MNVRWITGVVILIIAVFSLVFWNQVSHAPTDPAASATGAPATTP